jgi:hypothetical protein
MSRHQRLAALRDRFAYIGLVEQGVDIVLRIGLAHIFGGNIEQSVNIVLRIGFSGFRCGGLGRRCRNWGRSGSRFWRWRGLRLRFGCLGDRGRR